MEKTSVDAAGVCERFESAWQSAQDVVELPEGDDARTMWAWCAAAFVAMGAVHASCRELAEVGRYWRQRGMRDMAEKYSDRERECANVLRRLDRRVALVALRCYQPADYDA